MKVGEEILSEINKREIFLCDEWADLMSKITNYSQLSIMYFKGDDWSMKNDFPNIEVLRKHKDALLPYGMKTDIKERLSNIERLAIFGDSDVELEYGGYDVAKLIIRHNSKAKIKVKGNAILSVNILDNSQVEVDSFEESKTTVYNYSENSKITASGNVKIKKRSWEK